MTQPCPHGANMQRQAVPLIDPKAPTWVLVMEYQAAYDQELQPLLNMMVKLMQMQTR